MQFAEASNLDWNVVSAELSYPTPDGYQTVDNRVALLRTDTFAQIGMVSPTYEIFQNSSLKELVNPMVEEGMLEITNIGEIGGGRKVFIQAKMAQEFVVVGEETQAMLTFLNSHDGCTPLSAGVTSTRVICQNTFAQAMTDMDSRLRHLVGINEKAVTIQETANYVNAGMKKYQEAAEVLSKTMVSGDDMDRILAHAFKKEAAKVRARETIQNLFRNGRGNEGKSLWDAVNGITEYVTHQSKKTTESRFTYANFGAGAEISRRAMDRALAIV